MTDGDSPVMPTLEMVTGGDGSYSPENQLAACIRESTAARGVDYWACVVREYSAAEWAEMTGRDRSTVSRNVRRAFDE